MRLAWRFSHDYSPYSAFDNNPVYWSDPSGADSKPSIHLSFQGDAAVQWVFNILVSIGTYTDKHDEKAALYGFDSFEEFINSFRADKNPESNNDGSADGNGDDGRKKGNKKTYEYKGEYYSSVEMLYADLLVETILQEASYSYAYTLASVLDNSGLIEKGFQMTGASSSTSFASKYLAPAIDKSLKKLNIVNKYKLPTHIRGNTLRSTTSIGRFITRWNGNISTAILIYQIADILSKTNIKYINVINGPYKYEKYKY